METIQDYEVVRELGQGSYARVLLAKRKITHKLYAIKQIFYNSIYCLQIDFKHASLKQKQNAINEARLLSLIDHPYIIQFKNCFFDERDQVLNTVIEYAERGDLAKKIEKHKEMHTLIPEPEIWKMLYQISKALKLLHNNNILHRDLKSANIFETANGDYKLADMNVSKAMGVEGLAKTQIGTPFYASPEIWASEYYNQKCDIWSLGIIAYELAALDLPFPAQNVQSLYLKISSGRFDRLPLAYSDELQDIISRMLSQDPKKRPTTDTIITTCSNRFTLTCARSNISGRASSSHNGSVLLKTIVLPTDERDLNGILPPSQYQEMQPLMNNRSHVVTGSALRERTNSNTGEEQQLHSSTRREKAISMRVHNISISNNNSSLCKLSNKVEKRKVRLPSVRKIFMC